MSTMERALTRVDPYQKFRATETFGSLNGVRALCCLMVVKDHALWMPGWPKALDFGYLGVDMFFTISGFLIVTLMIRERRRTGKIDVLAFYARRTLRIFPIYYASIFAVLLFYLSISGWLPSGWDYYKIGFIVLLTYTQDIIPARIGLFFPTWSLAMEEQFYLFWPTIERYFSKNARWLTLGLVMAVSQAFNFGFDPALTALYGPGAARLPLYQVTFMPICLGVALAYLLDDRQSFLLLNRIVGSRWSFLVFLIAATVLLQFCSADLAGWPRLGVHVLFVLLLGALVIRPDHGAQKILTFPPLARIGAISYGAYLYHIFFIELLNRPLLSLPPPLLFAGASILTICFAEISFRYFELPLLNLRTRFRK
jgi:peptidoglycan/LPS O-acetylase OafA/YrhL